MKFVSPAISRSYMNKVQSVPEERFLPTAFFISMFPRKVGSNQAGFSFLDLILLIRDSVDRSTLNYCNKSPPDTPNIPIESLYMNPDLNALLMYKLTLEQKAPLATEISFLMWDRNKATTTYYSARILESREKR